MVHQLIHLVEHIDKYSVGEYSLSYKLSKDEAQSILQTEAGCIYVPTNDHTESSYIYKGNFTTNIAADAKCYFELSDNDVIYSFVAPFLLTANHSIQYNSLTRELMIDEENVKFEAIEDITDMDGITLNPEYSNQDSY